MDSSSVTDAKRLLRDEMRRTRAALTDRDERARSIWSQVLRVCDDASARRPAERPARLMVLAFNGVGSEPDTKRLIGLLHARKFSVALPRIEDGRIIAGRHGPGDEMRVGTFGIPEPTGAAVDPVDIDVVIVPGLAFTSDGRRLGQGGGFYDRLLVTLRPDCVTCGIGFAEQLLDGLPTEPHDRLLTVILTDSVAHRPIAAERGSG